MKDKLLLKFYGFLERMHTEDGKMDGLKFIIVAGILLGILLAYTNSL